VYFESLHFQLVGVLDYVISQWNIVLLLDTGGTCICCQLLWGYLDTLSKVCAGKVVASVCLYHLSKSCIASSLVFALLMLAVPSIMTKISCVILTVGLERVRVAVRFVSTYFILMSLHHHSRLMRRFWTLSGLL